MTNIIRLDRGSVGYAVALLVLAACGAGLVLIYGTPLASPADPLPLRADPLPCTVLDTGAVVTGDDLAGCAAAWPHLLEGCGDGGVQAVVLTSTTRWALRVGEPPLPVGDDDDLALVRAWCAAATPPGR